MRQKYRKFDKRKGTFPRNNNRKRTYNQKYVVRFLEDKFKNQRTKKPFQTYKQIVKIYEQYPKTIEDLVSSIHIIGYWKDCFFLLIACLALKKRNFNVKGLEDFIYDHLIDTLKKDIERNRNNQKITTVAKWLPREKSSFDKKINFVKNFTDRIFPHVEDPDRRRAIYRKICSTLNKRIGTVEIKLSDKDIEHINFELIAHTALEKNKEKLMDNDICKWKMNEALYNKYTGMNLWNLAKLLNKEIHDFDKGIIKRAWKSNINSYHKELQFLGNIKDSQIIIEISNDIFKEGWINIILGVVLLGLNKNANIFITGRNKPLVFKDPDIFKVSSTIIRNCAPWKESTDFLLEPNKRIIEISTKKTDTKVDLFWHIVNKYPLILPTDSDEDKKIVGLPFNNKTRCQRKIARIIKNSEELQIHKNSSNFNNYTFLSIIILLFLGLLMYLFI